MTRRVCDPNHRNINIMYLTMIPTTPRDRKTKSLKTQRLLTPQNREPGRSVTPYRGEKTGARRELQREKLLGDVVMCTYPPHYKIYVPSPSR